ncbi:hypothetical protein SAMN02746066_03177 [Anaerosporobacter mobilis DSM 15930]|uniref:Uncharacterized protein n=1 Tax=Anaerosporobacter mobilis DSM 15930 TaxID=1120996 RepID=A0A1M7LCG5_9FIRM|nr:hypothetical protein SAMN02746066_03177 [Anaerosporobacter mobilis DSM 15930]
MCGKFLLCQSKDYIPSFLNDLVYMLVMDLSGSYNIHILTLQGEYYV